MAAPQTAWQRKRAKAREAQPVEAVVQLPLDPDAHRALARARDAVEVAEREARAVWVMTGTPITPENHDEVERFVSNRDGVAEVRAALAEAEAAAVEGTLYLMFRSLPPDEFEALRSAYTGEDGKVDTNAMTPDLVHRCHVHVEPGPEEDGEPTWIESDGMATVDEAVEFLNSAGMNDGDREVIVNAAFAVNRTTRVGYADLGKGSRLTPA